MEQFTLQIFALSQVSLHYSLHCEPTAHRSVYNLQPTACFNFQNMLKKDLFFDRLYKQKARINMDQSLLWAKQIAEGKMLSIIFKQKY